ncbi:Protein of unknown function DUF2085, transmembrane [Methanocaldococcus vulcanius M7]|uniref:DUF2085 domain-containing protein n=1 Tax=Methanocaldococcus vulcanius (strain ATCC 700851 / DSM 12094 / M7) TaxID=579137 RepID=C9RI72_METVM|nr:DUF2085 domain-containing protein [Methanocaldococcus vulcanius]ACX73274.1 Protein of unknown function DUF2085, transmembrane [Methanocaldococcus vulcanius M7]
MSSLSRFYIVLFISFVMFYLGIILAPYFAYLGNNVPIYKIISEDIYMLYSPICHQLPQRSFFIFGNKMAVCARCFGIYTGVLLGLIVYPMIKKLDDFKVPNRIYLILALTPMAIDGTTQLIGLRQSFNELRFITGFIAGFFVVFYIIPVFLQLFAKWYNKFKNN